MASASASGGTIYLTSKTAGTVGNYSLSASYTWNSGQFTGPSFTTSTSGSSLTGGLDAGAVNNNPYVTAYQYNVRGDLLCVHQKATDTSPDVLCTGTAPSAVPAAWRQRFFTYDSLSRILTAINPETNSTGSTTINYNYDFNGNMTSKTEPAPNQSWGSSAMVTISYTYDALNRLLDTTYSDGTTQNSSHRYDYSNFWGFAIENPVGREVGATAANGTIGFITSYDPMGRVKKTFQCIPGTAVCQTFTATYGPVGQLLTLGYPGNGFTVTYGYDAAARVTSATDSNGVIYAQNPTYWASGAMHEFTSPNFNNNKYHVDYNNRLQPTETWTGSAQGSSALFDKQYQYNPPNLSQMNNGDIYTVTNVKDDTRTQSFGYDVLNRLVSAGDKAHWSNTYTFDPWGNLINKNVGAPAGESLNKSADANNHLSGLTYDAAGNEIADGLGGTFVYDAENRINTTGGVTYTYDADGRRIKKSSGTYYWYGPGGAVLAETDSSGNWTNYIFFGGQRLARNYYGDIKYYVTDHLHSTAMFVDKAGTQAAILDDNDFYPWGGVVPGVGKSTSNNTIKFTGQYRDGESQLDYFGARYYANINGRFMSPDWSAGPANVPYAEFGDPQSLNLYGYVRNNPTVRVDLNGHFDDPFGVFSWGDTSASNMTTVTKVAWEVDVTTTTTTNTYANGEVTQTVTTTYNYTVSSTFGTFSGTSEVTGPTIELQAGVEAVDACHAQLSWRYGASGGQIGVPHMWWWISIGEQDYIISGTGFNWDMINGLTLNAYVWPGTQSQSNHDDYVGNGTAVFDSRDAHGGFASPDDCRNVTTMLDRANNFPNDIFAYDWNNTSNAVAFYVGWPYVNQITPPPNSWGWGTYLPGMSYPDYH